jgi:hypothetical protein
VAGEEQTSRIAVLIRPCFHAKLLCVLAVTWPPATVRLWCLEHPWKGTALAHLVGHLPRELAKQALPLLGGTPDLDMVEVLASKR